MANHIYVIESKDPETGVWEISIIEEDVYHSEKEAKSAMKKANDDYPFADGVELRVAKYTREVLDAERE